MKNKLLLLSALVLSSGLSVAQNVTVYGVVDAGVSYQSKGSRDGGGTSAGKHLMFSPNGSSPSIIGFRGTEDLGGGLKANFNLEGHIMSGNGSQGNQWDGLFGRQANVGLSGAFGSLTLGKQYEPAVLAFGAVDPRGIKETYSGLMTWAFSSNLTLGSGNQPYPVNNAYTLQGAFQPDTATSNSLVDVFARNAISYSVSSSGLSLSALYGMGEVAGSTKAGSIYELASTYVTGPLTIAAAYHSNYGTTASTSGITERKWFAGFGYNLNPQLSVKANYMSAKVMKGDTGELGYFGIDNAVWGAGVNYSWNPKNTLTAAYYNGKKKNASNSTARSYILSNDYALSKRTTLYGLVAVADLDSGSNFSLVAAQNGNHGIGSVSPGYVVGSTSTAYMLGIKHSF
jgi:predicted porin